MAATDTVVTSEPRIARATNVRLVLREPQAFSSPAASSTKHNAVSGAMRPGWEVPTAPAGSRNNHWSKPGFQPKAYSHSVSSPITPASHLHSRARREERVEN